MYILAINLHHSFLDDKKIVFKKKINFWPTNAQNSGIILNFTTFCHAVNINLSNMYSISNSVIFIQTLSILHLAT